VVVIAKMKFSHWPTIAYVLMWFWGLGLQGQNYKLVNSGATPLMVYVTRYYPDSSKSTDHYLITKEVTSSFGAANYPYVRIDIVAIDETVKPRDTIFAQSFDLKKIDKIDADLVKGPVEHITPLVCAPRLKIKWTDHSQIVQIGSTVDFKLKSKKKVIGTITRFDIGSITVVDKNGLEVQVKKEELFAFKSCWGIFIGARLTLFYHCRYAKMKSVSFRMVQEKYDGYRSSWGWEEI
jgi:hypothetical protein